MIFRTFEYLAPTITLLRPASISSMLQSPAMKHLLLFFFLLATQLPEVEITAEPHHHPSFASHQVRVFNVEVSPQSETLMHWHRHDYVYVTLGAAEVVNTVQGKPPVTVKLQDGQTGFLPGNFAHLARNLSAQPLREVIIELLQDVRLRHSPLHWDPAHPDEDRGLAILHGGTQEILFVKDGVRVSDVELQPNAAIPARSPSHPLLLVAVTDLDVYTNDLHSNDLRVKQPRTHGGHAAMPASGHFNSGDCRWLPDGFGRPIVNAGSHSARFITLEFP
jgi:quercetin dioxygenase-like cupin family protein